jgi:hypothetical protein
MNFYAWLNKEEVVLSEWQMKAAEAFLSHVVNHQYGASGKTFLLEVLRDFVDSCGNDFNIEKKSVTALPGEKTRAS